MKFLKNTLSIVALFAIGSVSARTATTIRTKPSNVGGISAPMQKQLGIKKDQLSKKISNAEKNIIDNNNQFTQDFIRDILGSGLSQDDKDELLEKAAVFQRNLKSNAKNNEDMLNNTDTN
jgi:hypothetical protein